MTALLITENFPPAIGGSARWFWELYRRLPSTTVMIAAGERPGGAQFDSTHQLRIERVPLSFANCGCFGWRSWRSYRRAAARIRELIRRYSIDRLHCGRLLPEGWLALHCGRPYACYVHGEELNTARSSRELRWMAARVLRRASFLVANSHNTARILEHDWAVAPNAVRLLHPGVDTRRFHVAAPDAPARAALGWTERTVILTVGRLQKRKGHDRMIEVVGNLRREFPSLLYAIIGDGEERDVLHEQVRRAELSAFVQFFGAVDDALLVRAYQQCDLFVLPNRVEDGDFEGFGMVLLEAQACGKAVIAGASGGTSEAVAHGSTGLIVRCDRTEELSAAVATLLRHGDHRQTMGDEGRRWVERRFDFDTLASTARSLLQLPHDEPIGTA